MLQIQFKNIFEENLFEEYISKESHFIYVELMLGSKN